MSEKKSVVEALAAVMEEVRGVGKDGQFSGGGASYRFRGIDAVVNAVGPALRKHRVVVVPQLVTVDHRDVQTSSGKPARETCVVVKYVFTGPDDSTLEAVVPGEAMDNGDKGTAKAMSVAFRIALLQALCLPTDDTDPDATTYERATPTARQQPAQPQEQRVQQTPVDAARRELAALVESKGWDMVEVRKKFAAQYSYPLRDASEPGPVRAFTKLLPGLMTPATNGAAQ